MGLITIDRGAPVAAVHGLARSPKWESVAKAFGKANPHCPVCAKPSLLHSIFALQIHHKFPFHFCILLGRADLELDWRNLTGVCQIPLRQHHLLVCHAGDWSSYMPDLENAITLFHGKSAKQIKASKDWKRLASNRPKDWSSMSIADRDAMRDMLDTRFPK